MRIAIGADHAGFALKEILRRELEALGDEVADFGTHSEDSVDYPDIALPLANSIARAEHDFGILICSNGVGPSIAANKVHGIRAALCHDVFSAKRARQHTDANSLCLGSWAIGRDLAIPPGKRLVINAGARIDLTGNARIISYSPAFFDGTEENPILIHSSDGTGKGLLVMDAPERSYLTHTTFDGISGSGPESGQPSAALTFYRSPLTASACVFSNNNGGEEFLSIIRSELTIDQALFSNIAADAIKGEFCTGAIYQSAFVDIGRNGLALRGADLTLSHLFMNGIGGEAVSAREESELKTEGILYETAEKNAGEPNKDL